MLLPDDIRYLDEKGYRHSAERVGDITMLVIYDYPLPPGYAPETSDILIQIPTGYPDAGLDMFWLHPHVTFIATNRYPPAADQFGEFLGRNWQRFSRHLNTWRPGVDSLASYLGWIRFHLQHDLRAAAA